MNGLTLFFYKLVAFIMSIFAFFNINFGKAESIKPENGTVSVIHSNGFASRLFPMSNGNYIAGYEKGSAIYTAISYDKGKTFSHHMLVAEIDGLDCDNVNFYEFENKIYLSYRAIGFKDDGSFYGSLRVSVSDDFGLSWSYHSKIIENREESGVFKGVWEPCLGELNGNLVCFYANDSTSVTTMQNIESMTYINGEWTNRTILSNGEKHDSRDGMPVWCRLKSGKYAMVIESTKYRDNGYPFVIQMLTSDDGVNWSEPCDVYIPSEKGSKAAAPGICETDDGLIFVTFQTDEDKEEKGDSTSIAKIICIKESKLKRIAPYKFSSAAKIFPDEYDGRSVWGGIYTDGENILYSAGTPKGAICNVMKY